MRVGGKHKIEGDGEKVTIYRLDSLTEQKQFGSAHSKRLKSDNQAIAVSHLSVLTGPA